MFSPPDADPRSASDITYSFQKGLSFFSEVIRKSLCAKADCETVNAVKKEGIGSQLCGRGEKGNLWNLLQERSDQT